MRSIVQPGSPIPERIQWVEARGRAFSATLAAGLPLLEAAHRAFAAEGFVGGVLNFRDGALGPFAYVMPALIGPWHLKPIQIGIMIAGVNTLIVLGAAFAFAVI